MSPFNPTGSVISTDLDNMFRGLYRDNSDRPITGTTAEVPMAGVNISPNTIGPTGAIFVMASGFCSGAGGAKNVRLYLGSILITAITVPAGAQSWFMKAWIYNTATNAQRIYSEAGYVSGAPGTIGAPTLSYVGYATAAVDTSQNQVLQTRTQNGSAADTNTNSMFDVFVVQIT
jgi:hypothetical protein